MYNLRYLGDIFIVLIIVIAFGIFYKAKASDTIQWGFDKTYERANEIAQDFYSRKAYSDFGEDVIQRLFSKWAESEFYDIRHCRRYLDEAFCEEQVDHYYRYMTSELWKAMDRHVKVK